jgi:hypothetical protein
VLLIREETDQILFFLQLPQLVAGVAVVVAVLPQIKAALVVQVEVAEEIVELAELFLVGVELQIKATLVEVHLTLQVSEVVVAEVALVQ